ncbi:cinnamoyl-CoA reductase, putative [Paecilomyces variotii No. 5]|uniref:Cinnamoyl-CoA reductase, putative n=1 Tax=Byssochlamys spectabilis (strain No. 5 / NBRC 109023) TaxID=1356009 RepID=V5FPF0_BYSSN|nr:cinnamoyl-CoA reductase, putative [Paecilomyces variotii No. 5]
MSTSAAPRTVVVVGATGHQGSGVVRALLASEGSQWLVRGITRDPNSEKAKSFLADYQTIDNRLTLVTGDVYDKASLQAAFADAYGVFAVTSESYPGKVLMKEEEMQHEIEAGRNMVLAAEECGIKHFVFSSLPDMVKATGGRFPKIHHMNNKNNIENIAREKLSGFTCLIPADGVVRFRLPIPSGQVAQWTDPTHDVGVFAAIFLYRGGVFNLGFEKTHGKKYLVLSPRITPDDMVKTFTRITGQPAIHDPISAEEFGELAVPLVGPAFKEDAKQMMEWAAVAPADKICYGALDADQDDSFKALGLKATSFEDWLQRSGWTGPA